jgi:hypothetical protein
VQIFGLSITRTEKSLSPPSNHGGWWPLVREAQSGFWQRNITQLGPDHCLAMPAVFACHTSICGDVAKNRVKLVQLKDGVWLETTNPAYSPVLRKPNDYQTRIQFLETWMNSKLLRGNTYVLKRRDGRGVVNALYVLNPDRVQPLVSDDGQIFYRLSQDNLSALTESETIVPAREIIHDRFNTLFHPLDIEACLDDGLGMDGVTIGTEFDVDNLLRLDSATQMDVLDKGRNYFTPNDGRAKLGYGPKPGGDSVYRQQQDFSLEALAKRDAQDDPFGKTAPATPPADPAANDNAAAQEAMKLMATVTKGFS